MLVINETFLDAIGFMLWAGMLFAFPLYVGIHLVIQVVRYGYRRAFVPEVRVPPEAEPVERESRSAA